MQVETELSFSAVDKLSYQAAQLMKIDNKTEGRQLEVIWAFRLDLEDGA